jgi:hypothetical protein
VQAKKLNASLSGTTTTTSTAAAAVNTQKKRKSSIALASSASKAQRFTRVNVKLFTKIFKPSLWLSCAQPLAQNSIATASNTNATFYFKDQPQQQESKQSEQNLIACQRTCCKQELTMEENKSSQHEQKRHEQQQQFTSNSDTGYETISRCCYESMAKKTTTCNTNNDNTENDYTIETVVDTTNSYSQCDLTVEHAPLISNKNVAPVTLIPPQPQQSSLAASFNINKHEQFNEYRTKLIGDLIEMEANFVAYLSVAVSTFTRPLRGFFIKQQDYFNLFQNIEKILIISENFLRSMDKWSAYDLYARIGQFYTQKLSLFRDAFTIYVKGYAKSKRLLSELKAHSRQFRLFLDEAQADDLTLANLLDAPMRHMQQTLNTFKQIRRFTCESKRNPSEAPHIDSVIAELKKILSNLEQQPPQQQQQQQTSTVPAFKAYISAVEENYNKKRKSVSSSATSTNNTATTGEYTTFFMTESTIFSSCSSLTTSSSCGGSSGGSSSSQNSDCTLCSGDEEASNDSNSGSALMMMTTTTTITSPKLDSILNIKF